MVSLWVTDEMEVKWKNFQWCGNLCKWFVLLFLFLIHSSRSFARDSRKGFFVCLKESYLSLLLCHRCSCGWPWASNERGRTITGQITVLLHLQRGQHSMKHVYDCFFLGILVSTANIWSLFDTESTKGLECIHV